MEKLVSLDSNIIFYILLLLILISIVFDLLKSKPSDATKDIMSFNYTEYMKGLMAVIILFCHMLIRTNDIGYLKIIRSVGIPAVSVFLFISGYIEAYQLNKKGELYFSGFIQKKICRVFIPWVLTSLLFIILIGNFDIVDILKDLFTFKTAYRANTYNWFLIFLLYNYLLLYIYKYFKRKNDYCVSIKLCLIVFLGELIWLLLCLYLKLALNWYVNSFAFLFGILVFKYKDILTNVIFRNKYIYLICTLIAVCLIYFLPYVFKIDIISSLLRFALVPLVCIFVFILSMCRKIYSQIYNFCGKISLEIFLLGTGIYLLYFNNSSSWYGILITLPSTIILSYIFNNISSFIIKKIILKSN